MVIRSNWTKTYTKIKTKPDLLSIVLAWRQWKQTLRSPISNKETSSWCKQQGCASTHNTRHERIDYRFSQLVTMVLWYCNRSNLFPTSLWNQTLFICIEILHSEQVVETWTLRYSKQIPAFGQWEGLVSILGRCTKNKSGHYESFSANWCKWMNAFWTLLREQMTSMNMMFSYVCSTNCVNPSAPSRCWGVIIRMDPHGIVTKRVTFVLLECSFFMFCQGFERWQNALTTRFGGQLGSYVNKIQLG